MSITIEQIKSLREKTGVSMMACKKALAQCQGDQQKAIEYLRKKGEAKSVERGERSTGEGIIASYIHANNKIGVLVKLACETDFVAKHEDFMELARGIAMQVAATNPTYLKPEEVAEEEINKEKEIWRDQLKNEGKPDKIIDSILAGKAKKYREENALLKQAYIKNPEVTIENLLTDMISKMGENVRIESFVRYAI